MRTKITKGVLVIAAVSGFAGIPAVSQARHGADDPAGHNANDHRRGRGSDDGVKVRAASVHHRRGRGADDAPGDDRRGRGRGRGTDDGPNHT